MAPDDYQRERPLRTASDQRFRAVVETAKDAIVSADSLGNITSWNPAASLLFGYPAADVIGRSLTMLMPPRFRASHRAGFARFLATGQMPSAGRVLELTGLHKDGYEFAVDLSLSVWGAASSPCFTGIMRDITQRKRAESVQVLQSEVAGVLAESAALSQSAPKILQTICELLSGEIGNLWVVDETGQRLRCAASFCQPHIDRATFVAASLNTTFERTEGLPGRIWATAEPETTLDIAVARRFLGGPLTPPDGLRGACGFPLVAGRQVIGVLDFLSREPMLLDSDLLEILRALGGQIGQFLKRKQTEEALVASEEKFRLLVDSFPHARRLAEEQAARAAAEQAEQKALHLARRLQVLAEENARLYQDLRDAVEVRDDFLAVAGHELKTPLAAMLMQVESLLLAAQKGSTLENLASRLERAANSGKRLAKLVDQLLDASRSRERAGTGGNL